MSAEIYVAKQTFAANLNGTTVVFKEGDLVDGDHQILSGDAAALFELVKTSVEHRETSARARVRQPAAK